MINIINDNFNDLAKDYYKLQEENEKLKSIINEVREYACGDLRWYDNESIEFEISNKLLEILDKGNK